MSNVRVAPGTDPNTSSDRSKWLGQMTMTWTETGMELGAIELTFKRFQDLTRCSDE